MDSQFSCLVGAYKPILKKLSKNKRFVSTFFINSWFLLVGYTIYESFHGAGHILKPAKKVVEMANFIVQHSDPSQLNSYKKNKLHCEVLL